MMPEPPVRTVGPHRCGSGSAWKASVTADWAATTASGSRAAKASAVAGTPRWAATSALTRRASSGEQTAVPLPLWTMARWNRPRAAGEAISVATLHPPGGLTEHGDVLGVPTERGHVVTDPLQGRDLVAQTQIGRGAVEDGEPWDAEPVVDPDQHDPVPRERRPVVGRDGVRPSDESPAVDPHHDRQVDRPRRGPTR